MALGNLAAPAMSERTSANMLFANFNQDFSYVAQSLPDAQLTLAVPDASPSVPAGGTISSIATHMAASSPTAMAREELSRCSSARLSSLS